MRKLLLSSAIVMAMTSVSFAGQAAESASLSVTGTITPATCDVALSSPSIELGNIPASTLAENMNGFIGNDVSLNVSCDAPAAIAVQTTDNRTSSAMTSAEFASQMKSNAPDYTDANYFGIGVDKANNKIGALMIAISAATTDGTANSNLLKSSDKEAWTAFKISSTATMLLEKNGYFASATDTNTTAPAAVTNAAYTLKSAVALKKGDQYPTGESVKFDGNVTFSVVYL